MWAFIYLSACDYIFVCVYFHTNLCKHITVKSSIVNAIVPYIFLYCSVLRPKGVNKYCVCSKLRLVKRSVLVLSSTGNKTPSKLLPFLRPLLIMEEQ